MKIYVYFVGTFVALVLVKCDEPPAALKKLFEECEQEIGITKADMAGPPNFDDQKVKCFFTCIVKKEGVLVDGKIVPEKKIEWIEKNAPEKVTDSLKADITECANKGNGEKDECDVGGAFFKCALEKKPL